MAPKGRRRLLIDSEIISPRRAWEFVRDASSPPQDDALLLMSTQAGARSLRPRCSLQQGSPFSIGCRSLGADLDLDAINAVSAFICHARPLRPILQYIFERHRRRTCLGFRASLGVVELLGPHRAVKGGGDRTSSQRHSRENMQSAARHQNLRVEGLHVGNNLLKGGEPLFELLVHLGLGLAELGVKVLAVRTRLHGERKHGADKHTVMWAERGAVCAGEARGQLLVLVVHRDSVQLLWLRRSILLLRHFKRDTDRNVAVHVVLHHLECRVAEQVEELDEALARLEEGRRIDTALGGHVGEGLVNPERQRRHSE
ncbi:hypothetical protein L1887_58248 [Cichorium endivia]|nr:hypothetical protein L1887_58248 [Cichorium endivia]